jgi:hypothetical protein
MVASMHSFARILSFPGERRSALVVDEPILVERRLKYRYPLDLRARFGFSADGRSFSGGGLVVNLGSGGVLVRSRHAIIEGALLHMPIEWPSLLDGKVPLQRRASGRVLRSKGSQFAATFERYEFRSMKRPTQ